MKQQYRHNPPALTTFSPNSWQSQLKNSTKISQISLPGSHDSTAYHCPNILHRLFTSCFWKTQDHDIPTQLQHGIRFFDFRIGCEEGKKLTLYHGPVYLGEFEQGFRPIVEFLRKEKSEFVGVLFQKEWGEEGRVSCGHKVLKEIRDIAGKEVEIFQYKWKQRNRNCDVDERNVPCVGDLRGKIWIIEAYPGERNRIDLVDHFQVPTYCSTQTLTDNTTYIIQNYWEGPQTVKKRQVVKVLKHGHKHIKNSGHKHRHVRTKHQYEQKHKHSDQYKHKHQLQLQQKHDQHQHEHEHEHMLKFNFLIQSNLPRFYARKYNEWFYNLILEERMRNLGIIVLDFPEKKLIQAIIATNFWE